MDVVSFVTRRLRHPTLSKLTQDCLILIISHIELPRINGQLRQEEVTRVGHDATLTLCWPGLNEDPFPSRAAQHGGSRISFSTCSTVTIKTSRPSARNGEALRVAGISARWTDTAARLSAQPRGEWAPRVNRQAAAGRTGPGEHIPPGAESPFPGMRDHGAGKAKLQHPLPTRRQPTSKGR